MFAAAPLPAVGRSRLFVDRVFTIRGAGTVVTGTLTGDRVAAGDEMALEPGDRRVRVRSLQTHERAVGIAVPVSRVAANLVGAERGAIRRGDVARPGAWLPTSTFDVELRAVRGLSTPLSSRGAFVHAGAAEADARVRFLSGTRLEPGARLRSPANYPSPRARRRRSLRAAGGGTPSDGRRWRARSRARSGVPRDGRLTLEQPPRPRSCRGCWCRNEERCPPSTFPRAGRLAWAPSSPSQDWAVDPASAGVGESDRRLDAFHDEEPLAAGAPIDEVRAMRLRRAAGAPSDPDLVDAVLDDLADSGTIERATTTVRRAGHRVSLSEDDADVRRLLDAVGGDAVASPPSIAELTGPGIPETWWMPRLRRASWFECPRTSFAPELVSRAGSIVQASLEGITVSAFREALGTSRKYALPLLEHLDRTGVTVRRGDSAFADPVRGSGELGDDRDLHRGAQRQAGHAHGGPRVATRLAEHVDQEIARPVGDLRMLREVRGAGTYTVT